MTQYPWSYPPTWCELHKMYCDWHPPIETWEDFTEVEDDGN